MNKNAKILIACEESGTVVQAFLDAGFTNVFSCDLLPTSGKHPERHIMGDVLPILYEDKAFETMDGSVHCVVAWDLIIAHPPCTYLSVAGANHLFRGKILNKERYEKGLEAKEFFLKLLNAPCPRVCVENPVQLTIFNMPKYTQEIQPFQFGHPQSKKTRLWLRGLPPLTPTNIVKKTQSCSHKAGKDWYTKGGKDRQRKRSTTFKGVAEAMAQQWGGAE